MATRQLADETAATRAMMSESPEIATPIAPEPVYVPPPPAR